MNRIFYYEFSIEVAGLDGVEAADALYDSGCSDALVHGQGDRMWVDFCRESTSYGEAVAAGIQNIQDAGGIVVSVEPIFSDRYSPEQDANQV